MSIEGLIGNDRLLMKVDNLERGCGYRRGPWLSCSEGQKSSHCWSIARS